MYEVRKLSGESLMTFQTLKEANEFILSNWNLGPMIVVETLTEETVARPTFLTE